MKITMTVSLPRPLREAAPRQPYLALLLPGGGRDWADRTSLSRNVRRFVRVAAKDWPAGHKPQGFLCWVV